jgi:uncharacterized protein (TIGR02246 family)
MKHQPRLRSVVAVLAAFLPCALPEARAESTATAAPSAVSHPTAEELHAELRSLRDDMVRALNAGDLEGVLKHLHPNVAFTAMDGEVCRGPEQVREFFQRMMTGPTRVVEAFHTDLTVDQLTDLYGDTGVAFGSSDDQYTLRKGLKFRIKSRWTCSLVRQDGRWLITSCHSSADVFDNPILAMAKRTAYWAGGGGAVLGLLIGVVAGARARRSRSREA